MGPDRKTIIVTGAGHGIGRTIALTLAGKGHNVVVTDIDEGSCHEVVAEIEGLGSGLALRCDVTVRAEVEAMVNRAVEHFGRVDGLVNNAGIHIRKFFFETTDEDLDQTLNVNLKGAFICSQVAAKEMAKNRWGRIVNIASVATGIAGITNTMVTAYTTSKAAMLGLNNVMALELGPLGINSNAIQPGSIEGTAMTKGARKTRTAEENLVRTPKGRLGEPQDVANVVAFLISDEADYINGVTIPVDGGWLVT